MEIVESNDRGRPTRSSIYLNGKHPLSFIVGTTIFATLNVPGQYLWIRIVAGLLSLAAAVLAALQTFFNYSDVVVQHKKAAADYEAVLHELDLFILYYESEGESTVEKAIEALKAITDRMDEIAQISQSIPDSIYNIVRAREAVACAKAASLDTVDKK
jgi:hypothetical protein